MSDVCVVFPGRRFLLGLLLLCYLSTGVYVLQLYSNGDLDNGNAQALYHVRHQTLLLDEPDHETMVETYDSTAVPTSSLLQENSRWRAPDRQINDSRYEELLREQYEAKYRDIPRVPCSEEACARNSSRTWCYAPHPDVVMRYSSLWRPESPPDAAAGAHASARLLAPAPPGEVWRFSVAAAPLLDATVYARAYESWFGSSMKGGGEWAVAEHGARPNITIVTHGTADRVVQMLPQQAAVWRGGMSVAVLADSDEEMQWVEEMVRREEAVRRWVDIHVVRSDEAAAAYPINMMRNVAQAFAPETEWMFVLDIDAMVTASAQFYERRIRIDEGETYGEVRRGECAGLYVYAIASWSMRFHLPSMLKFGQAMGADHALDEGGEEEYKQKLRTAWEEDKVQPMQPQFTPAYYPMQYERWLGATEPYAVEFRDFFEPYYITRRGYIPFDELFSGWGANYNQQTMAMALGGYTFIVDPALYVLDLQRNGSYRSHGDREKSRKRRAAIKSVFKDIFGSSVRMQTKSFNWHAFEKAVRSAHTQK